MQIEPGVSNCAFNESQPCHFEPQPLEHIDAELGQRFGAESFFDANKARSQ